VLSTFEEDFKVSQVVVSEKNAIFAEHALLVLEINQELE